MSDGRSVRTAVYQAKGVGTPRRRFVTRRRPEPVWSGTGNTNIVTMLAAPGSALMPDDRIIDGLAAAVARIERENQVREKQQSRIAELERHTDWLETRVGQLFFMAFLALAGVIVEEWFGRSIITLIISFCAAALLTILVMESWKTPILWRYLRNRPK